jgi:hypothetical protein
MAFGGVGISWQICAGVDGWRVDANTISAALALIVPPVLPVVPVLRAAFEGSAIPRPGSAFGDRIFGKDLFRPLERLLDRGLRRHAIEDHVDPREGEHMLAAAAPADPKDLKALLTPTPATT